jgi:hypothetical protein
MTTNRGRFRALLLFASLLTGVTLTAAACSSGSSTTSTTSSGSSGSGSNAPAAVKLKKSADCFRAHGVAGAKATGKDLRAAFVALTPSEQQAVYTACGSLLPIKTERKIVAIISAETSTTAPSTTSTLPAS